jgi:hypothetical protein
MDTLHKGDDDDDDNNNSVDYLRLTSNKAFPNIKYQYTSMKEIEKIISSLKSKNLYGYVEISV